ncbi:MAG TPA: YbhB/YbcL family Raf kinase inhibitor-like protein [Solirubrobacterales bacterium]|nr:YbhB/YbcL family Raf kinase inhibitor-like protein [Solirubrobacterales bacterium]
MNSVKTTASVGIILALAVAALALAGCGGGSSDDSSSATASSETSSSGSPSAAAPGGASGEAGSGSPSAAEATEDGGSAVPGASPGGGSSSGGKHGPPIAQPKGAPERGITPQERKEVTVASMALVSPSSLGSSGGPQTLPAEYTCDGKSTSPALRWQGVPPGTAELVLFAMNVQPVNGKLFFDWAVGGLSPDLDEIEAGKLPRGAVTGRNSFGKVDYEICPEGSETYMFILFALPKKLSPSQGFEPFEVREAATNLSGNAGLLALSYTRG